MDRKAMSPRGGIARHIGQSRFFFNHRRMHGLQKEWLQLRVKQSFVGTPLRQIGHVSPPFSDVSLSSGESIVSRGESGGGLWCSKGSRSRDSCT